MSDPPQHLIPSEGGFTETILHRFCPWCRNDFKFGDMFCEVCGSSRGSIKIQEGLISKPRWRKILYKKQPYEDNYVDETFLMGLKKNAHFSVYSLKEVVKESTVITQQLSVVVLFTIIFIFTLDNTLSVTFLTSFGVSMAVFGFLTRIITDGSYTAQGVLVGMKTIILLFGSLFTLSPVLRTLTKSISDDTITACTSFLLVIHVFFHDYSYVNGSINKFSAPVSLNAAIFASVLLASRLPSNLHVFALISIAIELFALFPILRHYIKKYSEYYHHLLTVVMVIVSFTGLLFISVTLATIYASSIIFITIGCPFWLIIIQKYKNEINGPWDEAVPVTSMSTSVCNYCSAEDSLVEDHRSGDVICYKCGTVQPEQLLDSRPVLDYDNDDHGERDRTHIEKVMDDFTLQGTTISASNFGSSAKSQQASKLCKIQKIAEGASGKQEHHLKEAFAKIDELCETLDLPNGIKQTAKEIFKQYETTRRSTPKGLRKDSFLVAVLSVASKHEPGGRSLKHLAEAMSLQEKEIKKFFKILIKEPCVIKSTSGRKSMVSEVENLVDQFCNKLQLPFQIIKKSKEVAIAAASFLEGKRQSSIAAASIQFVVSHIVRVDVKPQDIADVASVSSNTLRNVYQSLKENIYQLPQDLFQARIPSTPK